MASDMGFPSQIPMIKAVILAGGLGTRFGEETLRRPKPLIEIGGYPILWHIMKLYEHHGIRDFVICAGYRADAVVEFFLQYRHARSDIEIDLHQGNVTLLRAAPERWRVKIINTGPTTETGGRLKRVHQFVKTDRFFLLTYGDTLTDVDVTASINFHASHGRLATMSVVSPPNRFGKVVTNGDCVTEFREKQPESPLQLNAGFFVLSPQVLAYIDGDQTVWEREPLENLALARQLMAWRHNGFWQPMDTPGERDLLTRLWETGTAPWKVW